MEKESVTLQEVRDFIDDNQIHCSCLKEILSGYNLKHYEPHEGGIQLEGYPSKSWVYVHCDSCGYDWALHKLVNRATSIKQNPSLRRERNEVREGRSYRQLSTGRRY